MRRALSAAAALIVVAGAIAGVAIAGTSSSSGDPTFKIELDNAFGLTTGADFKVAGVNAGTIKKIDLPRACVAGNTAACHALVTIKVTKSGFGSFHADAFCLSRPQSLIGEYFISCDPGHSGPVLRSGSIIPVTHTQSTIAGDLLLDIMRMPYRQRLSLIIGELGAAAAGRSGDIQAALQRAVPALTETDNLLNLLGNDSRNIQQLTVNADSVITALANNSADVQRFIVEADNAASATATQRTNLASTLQKLPGFLEQLRPALAKLGAATDANTPVLSNLNASAGQINRLFTDLPAFSRGALPAVRTLGQASVTGRAAVIAAKPTINHLRQFAAPTPELAQNLAIVLHDLDDRNRATERNARSPGGQGYTGLESLLQFAFNLSAALNTYGPFGHQLSVDAFVSAMCTPYATPGTIAANLKLFGPRYRSCYAWLGPSQPGVNESDSSNPGGCVPDPGGAPPGKPGPTSNACQLAAASDQASSVAARSPATRAPVSTPGTASTAGPAPSGGGGTGPPASSVGTPATPGGRALGGIGSALNQLLSTIIGSGQGSSGSRSAANLGNQTKQLLNYLLSP
jgi:virulence factor Mce-like protein